MRFQYSLNTSTIRPAPLLEKIRIAGVTGYEAIELWHDDVDAYLKEGGKLADVKHALQDQGLQVPTMIYLGGWFDAAESEYPGVLAECRRRMEQAAELGATYVIAGPPLGQAEYRVGAERYAELLTIGRQIGVRPAMEFLGFVSQLNTIEEALQVMSLSGDSEATTVLDPFHVFRGGGSVDSIASLSASQIAISHFNDVPAEPARECQHDSDRVMPGAGVYDLKKYLQLLAATGYDRWLSLELFREDLWERDPQEVAREGLEKMHAVVDRSSE